MPEETEGNDAASQPDKDSAQNAPIQPPGVMILAKPCNTCNCQGTSTAEKVIEKGERALILLGILALTVNSFIGYVYWQQLKEMVGAAGQTDSLTHSYRSQARDIQTLAKETHDLAVSSGQQATSTQTIAVNSKSQSKATEKSATAATSAAATAQQQLDSSERPWMLVRIQLALLPNQPSAIYFDPSGNLHVGIVINSQNVGKSPAVKVRAIAKLIPSTSQVEGEAEERTLCDAAHGADNLLGDGDTVFVGVPYQIPQYLETSSEAIKAELGKPSDNSFTMQNGRRVFMVGDTDMFGSLPSATAKYMGGKTDPAFSVVGCMDYSIDYSERRLQTMFLYRLDGIDFHKLDTKNATIGMNSGWGNKAK